MTGRPMGYGGASLSITPQDAVVATFGALASDGLDGDFTVAVSTTFVPGRDYYFNNLLVDGTYDARGHRIFCRKLTISATGIIHCDGAAAAGAVGGAAFTQGALPPNIGGVNGGTGIGLAGTAAGSCCRPRNGTLAAQYKGGAGGASGTPNAGGVGGSITVASLSRVPRSNILSGITASTGALVTLTPASSGGAGGGDGSSAGGGSGAGGGYGFLCAGEVINNGIIRALGGAGGNAAGGNAGGGGGGGGGVWELTVGKWTGAFPVCTGGAGGAKAGTGVAGSAGNDGEYFLTTFKAA